ncbi:MAG: hypothetical protein NVSMB46_04090 [Candidatus Saccharimonadales bacterium]
MLLVKTFIKESAILGAGLGLFAEENIAKDTRIWKFTKGYDEILNDESVDKLDDVGKKFIKRDMPIIIKNIVRGFCVSITTILSIIVRIRIL